MAKKIANAMTTATALLEPLATTFKLEKIIKMDKTRVHQRWVLVPQEMLWTCASMRLP